MTPHAQILHQIRQSALVAAVRVRDGSQALDALAALLAGGLEVAEIPMSVKGGVRVLESAIADFGGSVLLGAGTVLDGETARVCILGGAQFLVSPSVTLPVIEMGRRYGIPVFSGALTPAEIIAAWSAGADCVKVFPAGALGGPRYIRSLKAVLPHVEMMPMGGVSLGTVGDYLNEGSFAVGVGNDLISPGMEKSEIEARARAFKESVLNARRDGK